MDTNLLTNYFCKKYNTKIHSTSIQECEFPNNRIKIKFASRKAMSKKGMPGKYQHNKCFQK